PFARSVTQTALFGAGVAVTWLFLPLRWGDWPYVVALLVAILLMLVFPVRPFIDLFTTHIVVTTQRVIRKSRWIGIHWVEISLDKIHDVHYTQNVIERLVRAGDVSIESAGRAGQEVFEDLPDPGRRQRILTELKGKAAGGPAAISGADERGELRRLHEEGVVDERDSDVVSR